MINDAPEPRYPVDDAPGPRYPVDDVREMKNCELHQPMKNMTFNVVSGDA
jgi:hypothetical protein